MDTYRNWPKHPLRHNPRAVTYAREQAGLTKTKLAELCGVTVGLISEIEKGTRNATPQMLNRLADALNCPRTVLERAVSHDQHRYLVGNELQASPRGQGSLNLTRVEAEAFIRFAVEFLGRAKWAQATPEGLQEAYLDTIPVDDGYDDLHTYRTCKI